MHFCTFEKKGKTKIFESNLDAKPTVIVLSSFYGHQNVWNQVYLRYLHTLAVVLEPSEIKSIATFITYGFIVFGKFTD